MRVSRPAATNTQQQQIKSVSVDMAFSMLIAFLSSLLLISSVKGEENCDLTGRLFYDELKCTPNTVPGKDCPISYDCPEYKTDPDYCTFLGNRYNRSEKINEASYCNRGCFCEGNNSFICPIIDCYFGPVTPDCYKEYALRQCCPSFEEKCPPFSSDIPKCEFQGKSYYKGQIIDTGDTCWNCVCQEGFRGVFEEPYCIRRPCDVELRYTQQIIAGCAPIYRGTYTPPLCCPSDFFCPDQVDEMTVEEAGNDGNENDPQCSFGERKFNIADGFVANYTKFNRKETIACKCRLPPYMSCISMF